MKSILLGGAVGLAAIGGIMALSYGSLSWSGILGQKAESIRYEIHKESQVYRDGMQNALAKLMREYQDANAAGQKVIEATIRHQFAQTDTSEFPQYLQDFLGQLGIY